ncbi:hypothetical protein DRO61_05540 [Candidatus Bathyarchaeota archaeon]|nr:MAG: hypothetical protein DRO61_05540 [Candidatus Bathyarchaeota archaeon]
MSNTILRYVVDDISKDLKQVADDKKIERAQVAYWVLMVGNRLKSQHIQKRDSGMFLHTYVGVPVEKVASSSNPNTVEGRKRIKLPASIFDFNKDRGIDYISYWIDDEVDCPPEFTNKTFTRTTPKTSAILYMDEYTKPSPSNPYWYLTGMEYVYFLGIEKVDVESIEIGLYSTFDPLTEIDLDAPFDFPEELLNVLKRQVLDLGRFVLQIPEERRNDGVSTTPAENIPTQKLISVNDSVNKSEE